MIFVYNERTESLFHPIYEENNVSKLRLIMDSAQSILLVY